MTTPHLSYFRTRNSTPEIISLTEFIEKIKNPEASVLRLLEQIKTTNDKTRQTILKGCLPSVTISGTFKSIKKEDVQETNDLICIDFDNVDNPVEFRNKIADDEYTLSSFLSASGKGVAAIVKVESDKFKDAFLNLEQYYKQNYGVEIDGACKNINRLRFLSHDPDIKVNNNSKQFKQYSFVGNQNERIQQQLPKTEESRPGDTFNDKGDVQSLLLSHGWTLFRDGKEQQWTRPGKMSGVSATWNGEHLYVFTSSTTFEPNTPYTAFGVYTTLEHGGDFKRSTQALGNEYKEDIVTQCPIINLRKENIKEEYKSLSLPLSQFMVTQFKKEEIIIDDLMERTDIIQMIAPSKSKKTFFVLQLADCLAQGKDFFDFHIPKAQKVLFVNMELKNNKIQSRIRYMRKNKSFNDNFLILNLRQYTDRPILDVVADEAAFHKPALIIYDPLYLCHDVEENNAKEMKPVLRKIGKIAKANNSATILVHHDAKGTAGDRNIRDRGAGSGVVGRFEDGKITITPHANEKECACIEFLVRDYKDKDGIVVEFKDGRFEQRDDISFNPKTSQTKTVVKLDDVASKTADYIKENGAMIRADIDEYIQNCGITSSMKRQSIIKTLKEKTGGIYMSDKHNRTYWLGTAESIGEKNEEIRKERLGV